jgi:ADP-heptose:LPS heptosyltransferase
MWYPFRVPTSSTPSALPIASAPARLLDNFWPKALQAARWRIRGLLSALPARSAGPAALGNGDGARIAYLFAGTYGDFVQALACLARLAGAYPRAEIILCGAERYAREFASELPPSLRIAKGGEPWTWSWHRVDLLLTNCVGVYRVRFECVARLCARRAFGFRHAHEKRRGGYSATVPLLPATRSFAEENLKTLDLAGVPALPESSVRMVPVALPGAGQGRVAAWGRGKILFHIGSAGLKRDFGLRAYTRLVLAILNGLDGRPVEVIMGPGDEDVALEVRTGTGHVPQMYPLVRLIRILRTFEGTMLCFNSFPAHICHYLGKPALVIHREAVPYGYDCAPLHRQLILQRERDWDLGEVWEALGPEATPPRATPD